MAKMLNISSQHFLNMKTQCRALLWPVLRPLPHGKPAAVWGDPQEPTGGVRGEGTPPLTTSSTNWPGKRVSPQKADPPAPGKPSAEDRNHATDKIVLTH